MLILDASRTGMILDCPRKAQFYRANAVPRDPVQSAAQLVGEWAHAAWLLDVDPKDQPWPPRVPIRWDKTTLDHWMARAQAQSIAERAAELIDTVTGGPRHRRVEHSEAPFEAELIGTLEGTHVLSRARADLAWRHADGTIRIAELKTGQVRPSDVMQLAMTVAALGMDDALKAKAWLLYVPRAPNLMMEARGFEGSALYVLDQELADTWYSLDYPVPSHWCQGCAVEECSIGRPEVIRPEIEDGLLAGRG